MSDLLASFPPELGELLARIRASIALVDAEQLTQLANDRPLTQDAFNSITSQIKQELHRVDNNLEELELLADECEDESTRSNALKIVEEHRKDAVRLRSSFRMTSLEAKRALSNTTFQSSRAELLSGATTKPRPSNTEDALMTASSDVTQSLRNTLEIMRQELDRSVMSTHLLEQQTATLQLTSDQYMTFGELMKTSRALISSLQRADLMDRILLSGALLFFGLVCMYILKKRILDRGVSLLSTILSPLSRMSGSASEAGNKMIVSSNGQDDVLTAAAAAATGTAMALIPSITTPDIPPLNPAVQQPNKPPLKPATPASSNPQTDIPPVNIHELGLLHEEL
ncbi:hypothetical protein PCANC_01848 [Puccinia coronata f. sp. avenae]|uniref:Sec20 C-terminal domain-containing protein n=1 Tax=Puccinia coronata f. sp. avenae TaxID=200324 RepID=A0A2N5T8S5_9BASI|nr:hypothetical protein PCANC_03383 [Puccinia coronata f. sp. avenae]PLW22238.1 hypothetical protein PCASD_17247 [Puccinia coronata f. sp. avenae]PLW57348.1 hypothetical protein PCANC_01848 [Puccinia coronata f. sp. avenae]